MAPPEDWDGFGIRLGREIDRWPGGGQRSFAKALAAHAKRLGLNIPVSYRTLVNYLNGRTRPSAAWIDAAATVLRSSPEWLIRGVKTERHDDEEDRGVKYFVATTPEARPRTQALVRLILNEYFDLPMPARQIIHDFATFYYGEDVEGWDNWTSPDDVRRRDVAELVRDYFGPLLGQHTLSELQLMSLASSLAAAAYLRLAASGPTRRTDHA